VPVNISASGILGVIKLTFLINLFFFFQFLNAATIGSDTAVSRVKTQQSISDGDRVAGFVALDEGFDLGSGSFTYDGYFSHIGCNRFE